MELAQAQQTTDEVIDFLHGVQVSGHDSHAMLAHWSGAGAEVFPVGEVSLRLRVDEESPGKQTQNNYNVVNKCI